MSRTNTPKSTTAALVVFGQTDKGAKHAAWFTADEMVSAKRAAGLRSLSVLEPLPHSLNDDLAKIPRGRFVVGQISLAKVPAEVFAKLVAGLPIGVPEETPPDQPLKDVNGKAGGAPPPAAPEPAVPTPAPAPLPVVDPWQLIKVGDIVVAEYSKEDGWWEARVVMIEGDLLRLSWCDGTGPWREMRSKVALMPRRA